MLEDIIKDKLDKLKKYRESKNPYPNKVSRIVSVKDVLNSFFSRSLFKSEFIIAGRVMSWRDQGKILFADIQDESGKVQIILKKNKSENFHLLKKTADIGDFLEVKGKAFKTKRGEKSILVSEARIISKSLRPLPSHWYGLEDKETKLRKRYLDTLLHPEARDIFIKKSNFWREIRNYLESKNFLEVETPVLENIPGGAEAEPFITHHNALDKDFYLRISLELSLKKMLVGGFEKIFEIGRIFRNEGIDKEHLQDYTQMECYWAYADYEDMMKMVKDMYQKVIYSILGSLKTKYGDHTINWGGDWNYVEYFEIFEKETGLDLNRSSLEDLEKKANELGVKFDESAGKERLIDLIFKNTARPKLLQPSFLINPPIELEPLAKKKEGNPTKVERFQIMAGGTELGKGFSELNDPIDQRERFEDQMRLREKGDKEAQMINENFLEALEYGMPPTAGFGMSERLFSVLMNKPVRETVFFPLTKQLEKNKE